METIEVSDTVMMWGAVLFCFLLLSLEKKGGFKHLLQHHLRNTWLYIFTPCNGKHFQNILQNYVLHKQFHLIILWYNKKYI